MLGEVAKQVAAIAIEDQGARGHEENQVAGALTVAQGDAAWAAIVGAPMFLVDNLGEAVGAGGSANDDAAAVTAIAAIGAALGHVLFAPEAAHAAAAVAALDIQDYTIDKHGTYQHSSQPHL